MLIKKDIIDIITEDIIDIIEETVSYPRLCQENSTVKRSNIKNSDLGVSTVKRIHKLKNVKNIIDTDMEKKTVLRSKAQNSDHGANTV